MQAGRPAPPPMVRGLTTAATWLLRPLLRVSLLWITDLAHRLGSASTRGRTSMGAVTTVVADSAGKLIQRFENNWDKTVFRLSQFSFYKSNTMMTKSQ